jgi:hypothetical protein
MNAERGRGPALLTPPAPPGPALGVLSAVLERDGQQHSATQTRHQALADADHLALAPSISNAIPVSAAIPVGRSRAPGSARRAPVMALGIRGAIDRVPPRLARYTRSGRRRLRRELVALSGLAAASSQNARRDERP